MSNLDDKTNATVLQGDPIEIQGRHTADDLREAFCLSGNRARIWRKWVVGVLGSAVFVMILYSESDLESWLAKLAFAGLVSAFCLLVVIVGREVAHHRHVRWSEHENRGVFATYRTVISATGYHSVGEEANATYSADMKWAFFSAQRCSESIVILYDAEFPRSYIWFVRKHFRNESDWGRFLSFVTSRFEQRQ